MRLGICVAAMACLGCATFGQPPAPLDLVGTPAPDFAALRPDGTEVRLSAFKGKVVVLDLWASWCEGCEQDLPKLDAAAARLEASGVETLAVSLDVDQSRFARVASSRAWRLKPVHDPSGRVGDLYQPSKLPCAFVIDRDGTVRYAHHGYEAADLVHIEAQAVAAARSAPSSPEAK